MTQRVRYLFVQTQPSQLDAPFYSNLAKLTNNEMVLVVMNPAGNLRKDVDPELGLVPVFPPLDMNYRVSHVQRGWIGVAQLFRLIRELSPHSVIVQDQPLLIKIAISVFSRMQGAIVGMRSDKNHISQKARTGILLFAERAFVKLLFKVLCPVSPLTILYYGWADEETIWQFPYSTSLSKYSRPSNYDELRAGFREKLGIPSDAVVFLSVLKFVDRENPRAVLQAFSEVLKQKPRSWMIIVGDGPQMGEMETLSKDLRLQNVLFPGYVPYSELEQYFFASDVFVHLPKSEPWGISPQDALVAGLRLLTSDNVGAGVVHLSGSLARFVVPLSDPENIGKRLCELAFDSGVEKEFFGAAKAVTEGFSSESVAKDWANRKN